MTELAEIHRDSGEEIIVRAFIGAAIGAAIGTILFPGVGTVGGAKVGAGIFSGGGF